MCIRIHYLKMLYMAVYCVDCLLRLWILSWYIFNGISNWERSLVIVQRNYCLILSGVQRITDNECLHMYLHSLLASAMYQGTFNSCIIFCIISDNLIEKKKKYRPLRCIWRIHIVCYICRLVIFNWNNSKGYNYSITLSPQWK